MIKNSSAKLDTTGVKKEDNKFKNDKEVGQDDVDKDHILDNEAEVTNFKFCRNCGNKLPMIARFCDKCGGNVEYN